MEEDWFGIVRWCNGDIAEKLEEMGIPANDDNIQAVRCACENNHHFTGGMTEAGWAAIEEAVCNLTETGELKKQTSGKERTMKIMLPVSWEVCSFVEVEAASIEDAMDIFQETSDEIPLPTDSDYVDGSFDLTCYEPESIQAYNPDAPLRSNDEEE